MDFSHETNTKNVFEVGLKKQKQNSANLSRSVSPVSTIQCLERMTKIVMWYEFAMLLGVQCKLFPKCFPLNH